MWGGAVLAVVVGGAVLATPAVIWYLLFAPRATSTTESTSSDGMLRCTLTEWWGWHEGGSCFFATVTVERRKKVGEDVWEYVVRQEVHPVDDSATGCYYISWSDDRERGTTVLTVLGDYGPGPIPKKTIFTASLPLGR
jgi:hypothetical protein